MTQSCRFGYRYRAAMTAAILVLAIAVSGAAEPFSATVHVWDPPFNPDFERYETTYEALDRASRPWRVCVLIPHLKDAYWLAVNYGLAQEARRLGVELQLFSAGGYGNVDVQQAQFWTVLDEYQPDAMILSAVRFDAFDELLAEAANRDIPVVDMINGVSSREKSARVAVSYVDTGYAAGADLVARTRVGADAAAAVNVLWLPGPEGAGWSMAADEGFTAAIRGTNVSIAQTAWGDTGFAVQRRLIARFFDDGGTADYIVGNTVAAEAAVDYLRETGQSGEVGVLAYYYGPGVHRGIERGQIISAPTEQQGLIGRIAMDVAVRILEGTNYFKHVGPLVSVVDRQSLGEFDSTTTLAPTGFRPVFSYTP